MYSPRQRSRREASNGNETVSSSSFFANRSFFRPSFKRKNLSISTSTSSPCFNGDYQVLIQDVEKHRSAVRDARAALAGSLDQLGQHHVRQKEYDDAMDAFAESLHERRSAASSHTPSQSSYLSNAHHRSLETRSAPYSFFPEDSDDVSSMGASQKEKLMDGIVTTLRNMGNVHSLRGEQDEAMRYYSEVTNLRAQRSSTTIHGDGSEGPTSLFSGIANGDDNSAMMSEISEDVKALDDLFATISFRNNTPLGTPQRRSSSAGASVSSANMMEKRKSSSTKLLERAPNHSDGSTSNKRRKGNSATRMSSENEPFRRSESSMGGARVLPATRGPGAEVRAALDIYKSALEMYKGERLEEHRDLMNSFALRAELILDSTSTPRASGNPESPSTPNGKEILELSLEVFQHAMIAFMESYSFISLDVDDKADGATVMSDEDQTVRLEETTDDDKAGAQIVASTLIGMGGIYYKLGNRKQELAMYQKAKRVYQQVFGENHAHVAGTRKNIGMVLAECGEYEAAMGQFQRARQVYIAIHDHESLAVSRDIASAVSCMGNVKNRMGDLEDALAHYKEALQIYKAYAATLHDEDQEAVAANEDSVVQGISGHCARAMDSLRDMTATLKVIGMVYAKMGNMDVALEYFEEAMTLLKTTHGAEDSVMGRETAASLLTRMAGISLKQGDLDTAMTRYQQAYELTMQNRGGTTNHPDIANLLHYMGGIHHKRADYDAAMECYQESIRIFHATLGPGNAMVAGTLVMVGSIHYKRRNLDSAMMFYREALRLNRDAYGPHHPDVAPILKSIGTILTKQGNYEEAYDVFRDVLSIKATVHGTGHVQVASAYKSLGNLHYKRGELADAERQYRHALSIYRRAYGDDHPDTVSARTTIEHLKYWMKERELSQLEERRSETSSSPDRRSQAADCEERSC